MSGARSIAIAAVTLLVAIALMAVFEAAMFNRGGQQDENPFADRVDLTALGHIAVQSGGRLKALDSYTSAVMQEITGPHRIGGRSRTFTYFDMMFRPNEYVERPVIYVPKKPIRERLAMSVLEHTPRDMQQFEQAWAREFIRTGLVSSQMLQHPGMLPEINRMRQDLIRTARFVNQIDFARHQMQFRNLLQGLLVVPPPGLDDGVPWITLDEFTALDPEVVGPIDPALQREIRRAWETFAIGWIEQDAERVNEGAADLAALLPRVNPALYPAKIRNGWPWSMDREDGPAWAASAAVLGAFLGVLIIGVRRSNRMLITLGGSMTLLIAALHAGAYALGRFSPLELESFYFLNHFRVNEIWIIYLFSAVFLLMSVVYRWDWARLSGLSLFLLAFALHSAALLLRWYVSDRWPNTNMFEAVTTAAWFGGCGACVLEVLVRRTRMRGLFALGSAAASMTAFMAAHFLPQHLNANITNKMPVLDDVWLYIHTNVIIFAYVLIFMAGVVAVVYAVYRAVLALMGRDGRDEFASAGAGSLMGAARSASDPLGLERRTSFGQVLDGATMILVEVSFVLLWAGIVMGAMWADHSWGRPWGWDPKEVFALNTFIIFIALIHVRLKARDKGLWTSLLTMAGCLVMLFNWIFINFKISGLHSYA